MEVQPRREALKAFIKLVGVLLMVSGGVAVALAASAYLRDGFHQIFGTGAVLVLIVVSGFWGIVGYAGWRMTRNWNHATIAEYSGLWALFTAIALGGMANIFQPHVGSAVGVVAFIILFRGLKRFLLQFLGFPPEHSRAAAKMDPSWEVAGTPWQSDSGHLTSQRLLRK